MYIVSLCAVDTICRVLIVASDSCLFPCFRLLHSSATLFLREVLVVFVCVLSSYITWHCAVEGARFLLLFLRCYCSPRTYLSVDYFMNFALFAPVLSSFLGFLPVSLSHPLACFVCTLLPSWHLDSFLSLLPPSPAC